MSIHTAISKAHEHLQTCPAKSEVYHYPAYGMWEYKAQL